MSLNFYITSNYDPSQDLVLSSQLDDITTKSLIKYVLNSAYKVIVTRINIQNYMNNTKLPEIRVPLRQQLSSQYLHIYTQFKFYPLNIFGYNLQFTSTIVKLGTTNTST